MSSPDPMPFAGRRVLVTGGAGFIGSHLVERLLARGATVDVLDDLSTGRRANLAAAVSASGLTLHEGSVLDAERLGALARGADWIVHLAAVVGVRLVLEEPVRTLAVNVEGTRNVLAAAQAAGARVLYASSSEVYGCAAEPPFREDDRLLLGSTSEPRWSYAASKAIGEWEAFARAREHGLSVAVARLFNTVGPRQRGENGMVLPRLVAQAVAGEPLTIYGDGRQTRAFCHVADVCDALLLLLERLAAEPAGWCRVYNVGGTREVAIEALARAVRRASGSTSAIVHMPYREAYGVHFEDLRRRRPDVSRLADETGWQPRRTPGAIVRELVALAHAGALSAAVSGR